jgi:hypothetical protein
MSLFGVIESNILIYDYQIISFVQEPRMKNLSENVSAGLPDFLATAYQKGKNIPNNQKIGIPKAIKYIKWT